MGGLYCTRRQYRTCGLVAVLPLPRPAVHFAYSKNRVREASAAHDFVCANVPIYILANTGRNLGLTPLIVAITPASI